MTNKLVVIINSLKVPKVKKILLHEITFFVPNYSYLQNPSLGDYHPPDPCSLCPLSSTEFVEPPSEQNSWVCHWSQLHFQSLDLLCHCTEDQYLWHILQGVSVSWPQQFVISVLVFIFLHLIRITLFTVAAVKNVSQNLRVTETDASVSDTS